MGFFRKKILPTSETATEKVHAADLAAETAGEYLSRGLAYHKEGNQEKAEADTRQAMALDPENADPYFNLGLIYKSQGKKELARQAFEQAVVRLERMREADHDRAVMVERLIRWHLGHLGQ